MFLKVHKYQEFSAERGFVQIWKKKTFRSIKTTLTIKTRSRKMSLIVGYAFER
jgi:hypothetical protein